MKIPEFFTDIELSCKCGCGLIAPKESVYRLYALRLLWGKGMIINSAVRCAEHNKKVGGSKGSTHLPDEFRDGQSRGWSGCGFDIRISNLAEQRKLESLAVSCGFKGIGEAKTFLHIDDADRPQITKWIY
jgi:zinc D-Ala-D-Ala carboxypeptidase